MATSVHVQKYTERWKNRKESEKGLHMAYSARKS